MLFKEKPDMKPILRYSHPAGEFKNGLPIGNGRLAAMICGDEGEIRLALNHEWLWKGENRFRDCEDAAVHLTEVRDALFAGDFKTGTQLANDYFAGLGGISGVKNRVDPYQPAGDFTVTAEGEGAYRRTLDLSSGEAVIRSGETELRAFASFADEFIVIRTTGSASFRLSRAEDPTCETTLREESDTLTLAGQFHDGVSFEVRVKKYPHKDSTTLLLDIATSANNGSLLPFPADADYDILYARHLPAFHEAAGKAEIDVDLPDSDLDTDLRLAEFRAGRDPSLPLLYFAFGRYLMVSGSSGELPLNLQGKWNEDLTPPWECDYHLDVNLEMAYWAADALGLSRQKETLFNLCEHYIPHGREAALKLYGCRGVWFPIQTDVWGRMTPESRGWAVWIGGAAWMASHFARHWRYTRDETFLKNRAYPFLKEVATFFEDYLVKKDGIYHIAPSQSPENRFEGTGDFPVSIGVDCAMDVEFVMDTLRTCIEMAEEMGVDEDRRAIWQEILDHLPPLTADSQGRLNEFDQERAEVEPGHRHLSHLYGLYPGDLFPEGHPLREACERSLDYRLSHGGGHTGWSRSWVACLMARLGRTQDCWEHLTALICDFATETLLDLHPPRIFQIDGNMGGTAAICEMLLSCEGNAVKLLGALPAEWPSGSFRHFSAPGTLDVSCKWEDDRAVEVTLFSLKAGEWVLSVNGGKFRIILSAGETKELRF